MRKTIDEQIRFLHKVIYDPVTECWTWIGSKYRFGYGHFRRKINDKWVMYKAHRYAYEFYNGAIPNGALVCHHCDNPGCVNPKHLFSGTYKDNVDDMFNKGRRGKVFRNPKHNLLSKDIADEIRYLKVANPNMKLKELATKFNTSMTQISRILNNKIWKEEN